MQQRPKKASNRHFWAAQPTSASRAQVWAQWAEVSTWKAWDTGLKDALLDSTFELGGRGHIVTLQNQRLPFEITDYNEGEHFTYATKLPLGRLLVKHFFVEGQAETTFVHEVWFEGFTAPLFALVLGGTFRKMLPPVLVTLAQIVEQHDRP